MNPLVWGAVVGGALLLWVIAIFNSLIRKKNLVRNGWADIDVQLKKRYDLIPNLVEMVKGYMQHEKSVLEEVTKARVSAMQAQGPKAKEGAENALSGTLKTLFAVSENYPQLKASDNFQKLQQALADVENDLQSARRFYNAAVREYNNAVSVFPANAVATLFRFASADFFGASEEERGAVQVKF